MTNDFFDQPPKPLRWPLQEELEQPPASALTVPEASMLLEMSPEEAAEWIVARIREGAK